MIEVKDEILNGEPKYRLRDSNGNVIYDNVSVEMITPVVEEGTPLNKVLFDSIKNDLNFLFTNTLKIAVGYLSETASTNENTTYNVVLGFTPKFSVYIWDGKLYVQVGEHILYQPEYGSSSTAGGYVKITLTETGFTFNDDSYGHYFAFKQEYRNNLQYFAIG